MMIACGAAGPRIAYNVDIVRLRISAQKLVLISSRVARTYVSVSDWRVSYAPHDWSNSHVCVTALHFERKPDMSKFKEESWQKAFKAVKEQFELESLLPEQGLKGLRAGYMMNDLEKCFKGFLSFLCRENLNFIFSP